MRINPAALERLRTAKLSGVGLATIFERMAEVVEQTGPNASAALNLDYQEAFAPVEEGDLIPVITISLRPATIAVETMKVQ